MAAQQPYWTDSFNFDGPPAGEQPNDRADAGQSQRPAGAAQNNDPRIICLLGPTGAGKTSLLAAAGLTRLSCHGFSAFNSTLLFKSVPPGLGNNATDAPKPEAKDVDTGTAEGTTDSKGATDADEAAADATREFEDPDYVALRDAIWATAVPTTKTTDPPKTYRFSVGRPNSSGGKAFVDVVDSGGELFIAGATAKYETELQKANRRQLLAQLQQCDGIVLVLPAPELKPRKSDGAANDAYARHIAFIAEAISGNRKIRRIVVAVSKMERMFLNCGQRAFLTASDRDSIRLDMEKAVRAWGGLEDLRARCPSTVEIVYVPTSAFGFVANFGNPNLHVWLPGETNEAEHRLGWSSDEAVTEDDGATRALWRPYCVRDPFVLAAFHDENSSYTFRREDLFGNASGPTQTGPTKPIWEEPSEPPTPKPSTRTAKRAAELGVTFQSLWRRVRSRIDTDF